MPLTERKLGKEDVWMTGGSKPKVYYGNLDQDRLPAGVTVGNQKLRARRDLVNYPKTGVMLDGFSWGHEGVGPAQLALAILADLLDDDEKAVDLHLEFNERVIARLDQTEPFVLTDEQIRAALDEIEKVIGH